MSHEFESGFFARSQAWHNLGTVVDTELTVAEAFEKAGLNWTVEKVPTTIVWDGQQVETGHFSNVRNTDGAVLGNVGAGYVPVQNREAFAFADRIIGTGKASFHTAGSLCGGKRIWLLCRLPGHIGTEIDPVEKFFAIANSHDGSLATTCMITPIRIVCNNTLNFALKSGELKTADGKVQEFKVKSKHTKNVFNRVQNDVERMIAEVEGKLEEFDENSKQLMQTAFTDDQFKLLAMKLQTAPKQAKKLSDIPTRTVNIWENMFNQFKNGDGARLSTADNTAWGAVNAIGAYVDHDRTVRGNDPSLRANSLLFGSGAAMKQQAVNTVYEILENTDNQPKTIEAKKEKDSIARLSDIVNF